MGPSYVSDIDDCHICAIVLGKWKYVCYKPPCPNLPSLLFSTLTCLLIAAHPSPDTIQVFYGNLITGLTEKAEMDRRINAFGGCKY